MMRPGQSRGFDVIRTTIGLFIVPALWPLTFIGVAIVFPNALDPLLGGLQNVLYFPAFVWLLTILGVTLGVAKLFRLRKTNLLFFLVGMSCAVVVSIVFGSYEAWGEYRMIGQPGVIYPNHFDLGRQVTRIATLVAFASSVTLVTTLAFLSFGAFRLFKSQPA